MPTYSLDKLKDAVLFNTVEVIPGDNAQLEAELTRLIDLSEKSGEQIRHYIGFEISGQIHIGTGISSALKIKKLQDAGVKCVVWLADYHTWLNEKLDGNIETIRKVAREYFMPVLKQCCGVVGCKVDEIEFLFAEVEYSKLNGNQNFWTIDMKVGKHLTLSRVLKSISVTGKSAGNDVNFGTLRYAPMQVADCFFLQAHIVHAGMDQRKCHVLMREVASKLDYETTLKLGGKPVKPIAVHHGLLFGLGQPEKILNEENVEKLEVAKMSKSKPDSAVWVHDTPDEILRKIKKAYCPMPMVGSQSVDEIATEQALNPLLNWCEKMIFPAGKSINIIRSQEYGGNKTYISFDELKKDYFSGVLHPGDFKPAVARCLIDWFEPIREYVEQNPNGLAFLQRVKK